MSSSRKRTRARFSLEALEGRIALSHMGAVVEDGPHRHRRGHNAAEVRTMKHGADDAPGHDANDDRGGAGETVHHHRGRGGADDGAGHK